MSLPTIWLSTTIGDICTKVTDGSHNPPKATDSGLPMLSAKNIHHGLIDFDEEHRLIPNDEFEVENKRTQIAKDDVLLTIVGALGRTAVVQSDIPRFTLQRSVAVLRPLIDPRYFRYCLESPLFQKQILDNAKGTAQKGVYLKTLKSLEINIAPLAEQQLIADKLDNLLSQVESIKARLERIPEILKQFRQSILAAAVSGKLTEEWDVQDCLLSDVVEFQNGYAFKSEWFSDAGAYQVIKLGNIRDGRLFLENAPAYVDRKIWQEFERFKPNVGDTLISMTGTRFKQDYGFGCLVETDQDILINQRVSRLIPLREKITPEFLNLFIRSEQFRRQFFQGETGGVNQGNVGSKHIMSLSIKVPRIEIQIEVVNKVIKALNAVTVIERQAELALERVNNLTQSILAKAFRGELTAEWREANPELISGENSAEALLGRIKAERELAKPATKRGRGKA